MPFYIFAWIATFFYGFETILAKLTSKHSIKNPLLMNFLWNLIGTLIILPFALYYGVSFPSSWSNLIIAGLINTVTSIIYIFILYKTDVSVLSPLFNIKTAFVILLSFLFLGERLTGFQTILILIIFLASFFVSMDERFSLKTFFSKNITLILIYMFILSFYSIFLNKTIHDIGYWNTSLWIGIIVQIFLLPTAFFFIKDLKKIKKDQLGSLGILSTVGVVGYLAGNYAYGKNVSITSVIVTLPLSMVIAIILSFIAPQLLEKHHSKVYAVRLVAAAIMFIAAVKLTG